MRPSDETIMITTKKPQYYFAEFDGRNLKLTIDSQVQLAAEQALERSVVRAQGKYDTALVVEIPTGDILGWANYPYFNPNVVKKTRGEWKNRLAVDIFEPGSTLKAILIAAALQEKICTPSTEYFCENGKWSIKKGGRCPMLFSIVPKIRCRILMAFLFLFLLCAPSRAERPLIRREIGRASCRERV